MLRHGVRGAGRRLAVLVAGLLMVMGGMVAVGAGTASANVCNPGDYFYGFLCEPASPGSYAPGDGYEYACQPGTFASDYGAAACRPADPGFYVATAYSTSEFQCAPGSYAQGYGSVSCTTTPAGFYDPSPGMPQPLPCAPGFFSAASGATSCTPAPPGYFVGMQAQTAPTACSPGFFAPYSGLRACLPADVNFVVPNAASSREVACPPGTTTGGALAQVACTQQIIWQPVPDQVTGTSFDISSFAAASSGLPVSFTSTTPSVCTVSGTVVTASAVGTCTITASQGGSTLVKPAAADQSLSVDYGFVGFVQPVRNEVLNVAKAGRTIPLQWQLLDAQGNPVTDLGGVSVTTAAMSCADGSTSTSLVDEYASGSSGLQNLGGGYYQWNWSTPSKYSGTCQVMRLSLGDGTTHTAQFSFR